MSCRFFLPLARSLDEGLKCQKKQNKFFEVEKEMPLVETEATQESACVSTAPVFNEWSYKDGSKGWWLFPPRRDSKDAAILWWLWLVVVTMAASLGEMGYAERFFLYCLVLASQALLPCSSGCIAPFWAMILSLPFLIQKSYDEGGAWTYSMLFFLFGIVPLIDILSGADVTNHSKKEQREREQDWKYRLPTLVGALAVWVNCMHLAWRARDFSGFELVGAALSCGIYTGSVGITVGHELCHRASFYERLFGKLAITVCGYGHFAVEHSLGHHKKVGLDDDPATARFGENFWSFLPRCIIGEFRSALKLTLEHGTLFSELVLPYAFSGAFLVSLTVIVGKVTAIPFFLIQAFMAVLLFESVNF